MFWWSVGGYLTIMVEFWWIYIYIISSLTTDSLSFFKVIYIYGLSF